MTSALPSGWHEQRQREQRILDATAPSISVEERLAMAYADRTSEPSQEEPPPVNDPNEYGWSIAQAETVEFDPRQLPPLSFDEWRTRELPSPVHILGRWLTTTSRAILAAATGIGKSNVVIAIAQHVAAGVDFLHWTSGRKVRVLYIDGEMSRPLLKQRILDEAMRHGGDLPGYFFALSREDFESFPPLNSPDGQRWILQIIEFLQVELVVFDNIMSLTAGDVKDPLPWTQTMPLVRELTARAIGQIWVHHTGHDETRGYGDKSREWPMDTVIHLTRENRPDTDVSFEWAFSKARERTPENRADFQRVKVSLTGNRWRFEATEGAAPSSRRKLSPANRKALEALNNVVGSDAARLLSGGRRAVRRKEWATECHQRGLIDLNDDSKSASAKSLMNRHCRDLVAACAIACEGDLVWLL